MRLVLAAVFLLGCSSESAAEVVGTEDAGDAAAQDAAPEAEAGACSPGCQVTWPNFAQCKNGGTLCPTELRGGSLAGWSEIVPACGATGQWVTKCVLDGALCVDGPTVARVQTCEQH